MSATAASSFEVYVKKDAFQFHAARFVAYNGFRGRLHGNNYRMGVKVEGAQQIMKDGYVVDFGDIKTAVKYICEELNEHFLCPMHSDVMNIKVDTESVNLKCNIDGAEFSFPAADCVLLPVAHTSTEELAVFLWSRLLEELDASFLLQRGVHTMSVTVEEDAGQEATFRRRIPQNEGAAGPLNVLSFIADGDIAPRPFPDAVDTRSEFSDKLSKIAEAINNGEFSGRNVTAEDLEDLLQEENGGGKKRASPTKSTPAKRSAASLTKSTPAKRSAASPARSTPAKRSATSPGKSTPAKRSGASPAKSTPAKSLSSQATSNRFNDVWSFLESSGWSSDQRNQQKYFFPPGVTRENGKNRVNYFDSMPLAFRHAKKKMPASEEVKALETKYPELLGKKNKK